MCLIRLRTKVFLEDGTVVFLGLAALAESIVDIYLANRILVKEQQTHYKLQLVLLVKELLICGNAISAGLVERACGNYVVSKEGTLDYKGYLRLPITTVHVG
ncbi:hypothetical protein K504DRAFT_454931 [Pleomassaria siparia CBS 279.74]|uniref:Uncharacterized protein n=1 Tax=Pleomassaria siparia CBS 279.74 TaxID=1314801 RepID=A0A6G1K8E1_9PLEO|nr:hypothetical protein K504DRAFT_454931 [Pleomassaria siparia CBS 279.74]